VLIVKGPTVWRGNRTVFSDLVQLLLIVLE